MSKTNRSLSETESRFSEQSGNSTVGVSSEDSVSHRNEICDECGGKLVEDEANGDVSCIECGLVADDDVIDHGPEWRNIGSESEDKSRVGRPLSLSVHDKGLSTEVGWDDTDGYGNELSSSQRRRMQRIRKQDKWSKTGGSTDSTLRFGLGEIKRITTAVGLPTHVNETAAVLFRRVLSEGLLPGRSVENMSAACVYAASRKCGHPRTLDRVKQVCRDIDDHCKRHGTPTVGSDYRYICSQLNLKIEPTDPKQFIGRVASELDEDISQDAIQTAEKFIEAIKDSNRHSGVSPISITAAAVFCACRCRDIHVPQTEVASVADVSPTTVQNRYTDIVEVTDIDRSDVVSEGRL